jgi:phage/conjugal plasmid C-4 type zinc finger TraR family protein
MDQADLAEQYLENYLERAISAARGVQQSVDKLGPSAINCIDCADEIPLNRRNAIVGCKRCVSCQSDYEQRARGYSGEGPAHAIDEQQLDDILSTLA